MSPGTPPIEPAQSGSRRLTRITWGLAPTRAPKERRQRCRFASASWERSTRELKDPFPYAPKGLSEAEVSPAWNAGAPLLRITVQTGGSVGSHNRHTEPSPSRRGVPIRRSVTNPRRRTLLMSWIPSGCEDLRSQFPFGWSVCPRLINELKRKVPRESIHNRNKQVSVFASLMRTTCVFQPSGRLVQL